MITTTRAHYRPGYKYQFASTFALKLPSYRGPQAASEFVAVRKHPEGDHWLWIKEGYAWDGPSGPTIDTENSLLPSGVHDAAYQMMREGLLPETQRPAWDLLFYELLVANGMIRPRAWLWYKTVRPFAGFAAHKGADGGHPVKSTPVFAWTPKESYVW